MKQVKDGEMSNSKSKVMRFAKISLQKPGGRKLPIQAVFTPWSVALLDPAFCQSGCTGSLPAKTNFLDSRVLNLMLLWRYEVTLIRYLLIILLVYGQDCVPAVGFPCASYCMVAGLKNNFCSWQLYKLCSFLHSNWFPSDYGVVYLYPLLTPFNT